MHRLAREMPPIVHATIANGLAMPGLRFLSMKEWFSREQIQQRRENIKQDMGKGYFDNFKKFRDSDGKIFEASKGLIPAATASAFPSLECFTSDDREVSFPLGVSDEVKKASLTCICFREGAKELMMSWSSRFGSIYCNSKDVSLLHLSIVQHKVMSLWPFRGMLLRGARSPDRSHLMPPLQLFHFGSGDVVAESLGAENNLSAYAYLLDGSGLVRWQGSGMASDEEIDSLIQCTDRLVKCQE